MGSVPPTEIARLMAATDIFFLPSKYEGIAQVLFEAMSAGLPVVSADVGGQRELVTEECGLLIAPCDPGSEAAQYSDILANLLSHPDQRQAMGRAGRERVESGFRLDKMGNRMTELLDQATGLHRTHPQPRPSPWIAQACVGEAVEAMRRMQPRGQVRNEAHTRSFGFSTHALLNRWLSPAYHWGVARGWSWLPAVGKRIRRLLLGSP
ncbi:MAG: glycosyltransferase family 4 protein [Gemmatimonadaceae bacterium]|nr:glycosyltransferase family 4 protein [Gemmatimonadaceae bacterium]